MDPEAIGRLIGVVIIVTVAVLFLRTLMERGRK